MDKPTFVMLIGIPASGKSTYANNLSKKGFIIHSSDSIRKELFGDENIQDKNKEVFKELHKRVKEDLKSGKNIVYDATNISSKKRRNFLTELNPIKCKKICIVFATTFEKCKENNKNRNRNVPEYVIEKMYRNFEFPGYFEGWDNIGILYQNDDNYEKYKLIKNLLDLENFNQNNSHHSLTLGNHLYKTSEYLRSKYQCNKTLAIAGLLHDISKPKVATFYNKKGEITKECHYYNHNNVSSYDSMIYLYGMNYNDLIEICTLIQWHMSPYFWEKESTKNKYINIWGKDLFENIMKLHEADILSH